MVNLSLLPDFIIEAVEHLDEMESSLLQLEVDPGNKEILNDIFRSIHTIKGASQFTGIEGISKLSHTLENLLDMLRMDSMQLSPEIIDTLIEGKDRITILVNELEQSEAEESEIDDLLFRVEALSGETGEDAVKEVPEDKLSVEAPQGDIADESLIDESYEEEFDEELSKIFIKQLTESLFFLGNETDSFGGASNKAVILEKCIDSIKTLQSAANYMGYEKLTRHYKNWCLIIESAKQQLSSGKDVSLDFMTENIDKIVMSFPQIKDAISEKTEISGLDKDLEEAFTSIDELEAMSEPSASAESFPEEDGSLPPLSEGIDITDIMDEDIDDDGYLEEFDEELSSIFIKQLTESLSFISNETDSLKGASDKAGIFDKCIDSIKSLQSAANYMGYEKLTRHYKNWCLQIESANQQLSSGKDISFDFMSENIDKIINAFPQVKDAIAGQGLEDDLEEAFTSIDELEAMSESSASPDTLAGDETGLPPVISDQGMAGEGLDDINYKEEFDEELSDIFIQQLKEKVASLQIETDSLRTATNKAEILNRCSETVKSLQSAANYMGYDKLTSHYKNWCAQIEQTKQLLTGGHDAPFGFMSEFIEKIVRVFPQIKASQLEEDLKDAFTSIDELEAMSDFSEPSSIQSEEIDTDLFGTNAIDEPVMAGPDQDSEADDIDLFDKLSSAFDSPEEQDTEAEAVEDDLFNKLSNAFDSSMTQPLESGSEPMADVLAEMLFDEEEEDTKIPALVTPPFQPEKKKPAVKQVEEMPVIKDEEIKMPEAPLTPTLDLKQDEIEYPVEEEPPALEDKKDEEAESVEQESFDSHEFDELVQKEPLPQQAPLTQPGIPEVVENESIPEQIDERRKLERGLSEGRKQEEAGQKVFRQSVRVDADKIDYLMNQVGELVVSRAFFVQLLDDMKNLQQNMKNELGVNNKALKPVKELSFRLSEATVALGRVSNDLQEGVMKVRMLPISQLFNRYPRLVRDLVTRTEKNVDLEIRGGETELDKMVIEEISDPLIHLIRNAVDHGIETAEERLEMGKPETGTLILEAFHESNHIIIEITDDGRGIDIDRIKAKALENELFSKADLNRMSVSDISRIIMTPGFSTSEKTTQTSGRGVGMDVVKKNIEKLNGTIEIESQPGLQTMMRLKIPLTLAIIPALMVRVGGELFTIPLSTVEETLRVHHDETSSIEGVEVMHLRDTTMPIFRLTDLFSIKSEHDSEEAGFFVVVVSTGMQRIGLVVDELIGQEEVVIKPLEDYLRDQSGFSGATIIGDGRISLILDIYELIKMTNDKQAQRHRALASVRKLKASKTTHEEA